MEILPPRIIVPLGRGKEEDERKEEQMPKYGIRITNEEPRPCVGWIMGEDRDVRLFPDKAKAASYMKEMLKDSRYSWNCKVEVAEFTGWGKE